jgi:hypothetical protein
MHYKETLLKQKEIKFRMPKLKINDDGKVDIAIHIPLTNILEGQALKSFTYGVFAIIELHANCVAENMILTTGMIRAKFIEWGLPLHLANKFPEDKKDDSSL